MSHLLSGGLLGKTYKPVVDYTALPYSVDFTALPDGAMPAEFAASAWTVASGKAVCTPTKGASLGVPTNGDFTLWTSGTPNGWTKYGTVTQNPAGQLRLQGGGIYQSMSSRFGIMGMECTAYASGTLGINFNWGANYITWTATGYKETPPTAISGGTYVINCDGDATADNCVLYDADSAFALVKTDKTDVTVEGFVDPTTTQWMGFVARADDPVHPRNYIMVLTSDGGAYGTKIYHCVNGILVDITGGALNGVNNDTLQLICDGTSIQVKSTWINRTVTVDQPTINNNVYHGIVSTAVVNTLRDFALYET